LTRSVTRLAVLGGPGLRRQLPPARRGLKLVFLPPLGTGANRLDPSAFDAVLVEIVPRLQRKAMVALRAALPGRPLGGLISKPDAASLRRAERLPLDFRIEVWRQGDPPPELLLAHVKAAAGLARRRRSGDVSVTLRRTSKRLAILTDIVKTANSILEPRKVIELVMAKIQQLIPSEAWSMLLVDEQSQELTFELALGDKGKDVSSYRVKIGEGVAGWVAQTGQPAIVNDVAHDPRFTRKFDEKTQFDTRSILCAPLISRGRTIGVVEIINRVGGRFTHADLDLLLSLVEPCAIAIENAILFQRTEQLTITDDLTKLFNSRYLNLYLGREIKRCKRHGIPLSVIFLDLDGFKGVNDQYGHLAGSGTLAEVGVILGRGVRESDILARYGGDEFVVVLPETAAPGALVIAERLRKSIEEHRFLEAQGLSAHISASFGISSYPDHALSPEGLIQKADQAMYRVKEREKNGIEVAV
jgi:diguanylate cyclase (GGDEF)-like protein